MKPSFLFMNHLARLPNEILTSILLALDDDEGDDFYSDWNPFYRDCDMTERIRLYQCALVNKTFYAVATPLLWRRPIDGENQTDTLAATQAFVRCLESSCRPASLVHHIRHLRIRDSVLLKPMMPFMPFMPQLETFTMYGSEGWCTHHPGPLDPLPFTLEPTCTRLEKVSFWGVRFGDPALVTMSQWCGSTQELTLEYCTEFSDTALHTLLEASQTSLTSLKLDQNQWTLPLCNSLTPFRLPQLTSLSLTKCPGVDHAFLRDSRFPLLTECRILECPLDLGNAPDSLSVFLRAHPMLRTLTLNGCKINNAALAVMTPAALPNLSDLDLSNNGPLLSCQLLRQMINSCLGLSHMSVSGCSVPVRNFPELPQWQGTVGGLTSEDIIKIRNSDNNVVSTAEDDVLREEDRLYLPEIDLSLYGNPEDFEDYEED